jgi:hypothetical protein
MPTNKQSRSTPPRPLSPEVPVVSYPTPNSGDLLVVQDVDTRTPDYQALAYGTPHPDQVSFPGLKLVYQTPLDNEQNYNWIRRVYSADRQNQEAYNYAIKYSGEDPTKPIYLRTYTLPRSGYTPLSKGTPDPVYSTAVLVEEEVQRIKDDQNDGQLDSEYLKVIRVYETLPGPGLTTKKKGAAGSIPAKFQAARQVTITKTTVDASTQPDDTSSTIVESSVEQSTVAKAQKVNSVLDATIVTLTGEKVTSQQQVATVTETMVPTGSGQDVVTPNALTLEGVVDNLGNGQSVVTQVQAPSLFPETQLSREKPLWGIPMKFKVADPPLKTSHVVEGTVSDSDVTLGAWDMDATAEQITEFKKKVSKSSMSEGEIDLVGTQTGTWGVETVTEKLLVEVSEVTGAYLTKEDSIDPLGDGRAVEKTIKYPESPATLVEYRMDETTGIGITMEKSLVDPTSSLPSVGVHQRVDRQPIDKWNTIQIISTLDTNTLPAPEVWNSVSHYTFPDVLVEVGVGFRNTTGGGAGSSGPNFNTIPDNFSWHSSAEGNSVSDIRPEIYLKKKKGHSGPVNVQVTRTYLTSPPTNTQEVTKIEQVYGTVVVSGYGHESSGRAGSSGVGPNTYVTEVSNSARVSSFVQVSEVGPFVWASGALTLSGGVLLNPGSFSSDVYTHDASALGTYLGAPKATAGASAAIFLPPSSSILGPGDTLIIDCRVEKWRFGIWIQEVFLATYPSI